MNKMVKSVTLALVLICLFSGAALADGATVSVNTSASIYMQPERATFSVGVSESAPTVVEAQSKVNKSIEKIIQALVKAGIPRGDISLSYLSLYANYNYNMSPPTLTDYNATHQLDVRTADIENVGELIDAALSAGANQLNSVNFSVADGSDSYREALKMAVVEAKIKAEALAAAAGKQLGELVSIEEQPTYSMYGGEFANVALAAEDSAAGTEVMAGNIGVTASVVVVYKLSD